MYYVEWIDKEGEHREQTETLNEAHFRAIQLMEEGVKIVCVREPHEPAYITTH